MSLTFDFIGVIARDLAASLAFYRELGLSIPEGAEREDHVEIVLPNGMRLGWDALESVQRFDPGYVAASGGHRVAFAFQAESPEEVDRTYDRLVSAGHASQVAPWDAFWGQRYATVLDPDGNAIDLYAPLPEPPLA